MNTEPLLPVVLDLLLKSTAILTIAFLVAHLCRRASAANRHVIWLAAIASLLLLPLTKLAAPLWTFGWERSARESARVQPLAVAADEPMAVAMHSPAVPQSSQVRPKPVVVEWPKLALGVWLAGVFACALHRAGVRWWLSQLTRSSRVLPVERWRFLVSDAPRNVEILESSECRVPMATGVWRPVVLLPTAALQWSDVRLASALRHEFGHIRRRDCLSRFLLDLACAIYWVNPLTWLAARSMRLAQEQACDDLVLTGGADAADYATQLVEVVRSLKPAGFATAHALAMAQPSTLETRLRAIVDDRRDRRSSNAATFTLGIVGVVSALVLSTAAQLGAAEKAAISKGAESPATGQTILIEAKIFDLDASARELQAVLPWLKELAGKPEVASLQGVFTKEQAAELVKALNAGKGIDVLSTPRVVTRSGQEAVIEVAREFRYPIDWKKDAKTGGWEPTVFDTKNLGLTLKVIAAAENDHIIDLQLHPTLIELMGFRDHDGPEGLHADEKTVPAGHRVAPQFSTRSINTSVSIFRGQSVLAQLGGSGAGKDGKRNVFALVRADVVEPDAKKSEGQAAVPEPPARAPVVVTADAITFDPKKQTATASGDVRIETADATLLAQNVEVKPKPATETSGVNAIEQKAKEIIIPKLDLRDAPLREVVSLLATKAREIDPEGKGVNVALRLPETDTTTLTLNLENVPLSEAIGYVAELAGLKFEIRADGYLLRGDGKTAGMREPAEGSPEAALLNRARGIVIPQVEFKDAKVQEAADFLRIRSGQLDLEKKQVNVVVQHSKMSADARITLSLRGVSVAEALRYTAELAGLQLEVSPSAFVLRPPPE